MFIYLLMIGLVAFASFIYIQFPYVTSRKENMSLLGPQAVKCYRHPMFLVILALFIIPYAIRYHVGTDFSTYQRAFEWHQTLALSEIFSQRDFGYYLLERITANLSGGNWYFHCVVVGAITYLPVVYYYSRYSNNITYAILIYIFSMEYFSLYNGTRQTIAASMIMMALMYLMEKKYTKTVIMVFIAYTFHSTVIIILPLILLCMLDYNNKFGNFIKAALLLSAVTLQNLWTNVLNFLGNIGQDKLVDDYSDIDLTGVKGTHILRVAVYLVPVILAFAFGRRMIEYIKDNYGEKSVMAINANFVVNAVQIALIFMIAGQRNWIFARFSSYFAVYTPVFLSFSYTVQKKEYKSLYSIISCILFFTYMCVLLPVESNLLPFKTVWGWYYK